MSSNESSGAPAEGTATPEAPANPAAPASFGTTRGSGLARGKRPSQNSGPSSNPASGSAEYKPTAIEILNAPREYQNPFAPAPAESSEPTQEKPETATAVSVAPASAPASSPEVMPAEDIADPAADEVAKAELNILPPERPKASAPETWESTGFKSEPAPRREPAAPAAPVDPAEIPEKFLYVRPGHTYVPTDPRAWGPGRRERPSEGLAPRDHAPADTTPAAAPQKSGGFLSWFKGLFGGSPAAEPATTAAPSEGGHRGGRRRHRGGRGPGGESAEGGSYGERRDGGRRRRRGGRGRSSRDSHASSAS